MINHSGKQQTMNFKPDLKPLKKSIKQYTTSAAKDVNMKFSIGKSLSDGLYFEPRTINTIVIDP